MPRSSEEEALDRMQARPIACDCRRPMLVGILAGAIIAALAMLFSA